MLDPPAPRLVAPGVDPSACSTPGCRLPALADEHLCGLCARVYAGVLVLCHRLLVRDLARAQHDAARPTDGRSLAPRARPAGPWPAGVARFDGRELAALRELVRELRGWKTRT